MAIVPHGFLAFIVLKSLEILHLFITEK